MRDFATVIRELRLKRGMTQEQFAKMLGVTRNTVTVWESGRKKPWGKEIYRISEVMGVDFSYLNGLKMDENNESTCKAATTYTGLSEDALKTLNEYNTYSPQFAKMVEVIDFLITHNIDLFVLISDYFKAVEADERTKDPNTRLASISYSNGLEYDIDIYRTATINISECIKDELEELAKEWIKAQGRTAKAPAKITVSKK